MLWNITYGIGIWTFTSGAPNSVMGFSVSVPTVWSPIHVR